MQACNTKAPKREAANKAKNEQNYKMKKASINKTAVVFLNSSNMGRLFCIFETKSFLFPSERAGKLCKYQTLNFLHLFNSVGHESVVLFPYR